MELDHTRAQEKRREVERLAAKAIESSGMVESSDATPAAIANELIENFASFRAPEKEEVFVHFMTVMPGGIGGGRSTKPGNIRLNLGKLMIALSKSAFTTLAIQKTPWLLPLGALIIWSELWSTTKIDVGENDASVIFAMWMYKDSQYTIEDSKILSVVNKERAKYGQTLLSSSEVSRSLKALASIRTIERSKKEPSKWWLREWVGINFR